MKVEKIDHIDILVRDLDKAIKFYGDLFGLDFPEPWETPDGDVRETMEPLGIDFCEPLTPDGFMSKILERRGEGVIAVSLKVPNIDEAVAEMNSKGVRLLYRAKFDGAEFAQFDGRDTSGVSFQLIAYKEKHSLHAAHPM